MKKLRNIIFILPLLIVVACSSVPQQKSHEISDLKALEKPNLNNLSLSGKISSLVDGRSYNFSYNMILGHKDSIEIDVIGPFGLSLGKLFADNSNFIFLNTFESKVFKGSSTPENFRRAFNLMFSVKEFLAVIKNTLPYPTSEYIFINENSDGQIFSRVTSTGDFADFVVLSNSGLSRFQRKEKGNVLTMDAQMEDFTNIDSYVFPKKVNWSFPTANTSMKMTIDKLNINPSGVFPKHFSYGRDMTVIDLDSIE